MTDEAALGAVIESPAPYIGMIGKWTFLSGTRAQLTPIWQSYSVYVDFDSVADQPVVHQSRVILIDAQARQQVNYAPDFQSKDLVHDLNLLLTQFNRFCAG